MLPARYPRGDLASVVANRSEAVLRIFRMLDAVPEKPLDAPGEKERGLRQAEGIYG